MSKKVSDYATSLSLEELRLLDDFWYWVGFVLGDGSLDRLQPLVVINLQSRDSDVLYKFNDLFGINKELYEYKQGHISRFRLHSNEVYSFLESIGLRPGKSSEGVTLCLPEDINLRWFLAGFFDSDGSLELRGNYNFSCYFGAGKYCRSLLDQVKVLLRTDLHCDFNLRESKSGGEVIAYKLYCPSTSYSKFLKYLYIRDGIALTRKKVKALAFMKYKGFY